MAYDYLILAGIAASYFLLSLITVLIALYLTIATESRSFMRLYEYCPVCGGTGFGAFWTPCPHCGTTGYVPKKKGGTS